MTTQYVPIKCPRLNTIENYKISHSITVEALLEIDSNVDKSRRIRCPLYLQKERKCKTNDEYTNKKSDCLYL